MNITANGGNGFEGMAALMVVIGIGITIFWMVVGWRAMRAHERIAEALARTAGMPPKPQYPVDKVMV